MQYTLVFDDVLQCFVVNATGPATISDIRMMIDEILRDGRWRHGMNVIVDYCLTELNCLTSADVHTLASIIKALEGKAGNGRIAHVVSRTVDFGIIRSWENMIESQVPFNFHVFYSINDAKKWIATGAK